ncbi:MAG: hypothetical protein WC805_01975 [Patescibacteria group bacterium]|jgi:hypothetical protein
MKKNAYKKLVGGIRKNPALVLTVAVIILAIAFIYLPQLQQFKGKSSEAFGTINPGLNPVNSPIDPLPSVWTNFIPLTNGPEIERAEDIDGSKFVFSTGTNESSNPESIIWNIQRAFRYNLGNNTVINLPKEGGESDYLYSLDLEGNIAYWLQNGLGSSYQVYKSDGATTTSIPTDNVPKDYFSTDGDKMVYKSPPSGSGDIIVRSLVSGEIMATIPPQAGIFMNGGCLDISGNRVIWCESVNYGPADLWMYDISSALPPINLTEEDQYPGSSVFQARIDGNKIIYPTHKSGASGIKIYSYDISNNTHTQIAQTNLGLRDLNILGNDVVYISMVYPYQEVHLVDISKPNPMLYDQKIKTINVPTDGIEIWNAFLTRSSSSWWPWWTGKRAIVFTAFVYNTNYKDSNIYIIKQLQ